MLTFALMWHAVRLAAVFIRTPGTGRHRAARRWWQWTA